MTNGYHFGSPADFSKYLAALQRIMRERHVEQLSDLPTAKADEMRAEAVEFVRSYSNHPTTVGLLR